LPDVFELMRQVSQDGSGLAGIAIDEDECGTLDAVVPFQSIAKATSVSSIWTGSGSPSRWAITRTECASTARALRPDLPDLPNVL
jgi:hypothetical protein